VVRVANGRKDHQRGGIAVPGNAIEDSQFREQLPDEKRKMAPAPISGLNGPDA